MSATDLGQATLAQAYYVSRKKDDRCTFFKQKGKLKDSTPEKCHLVGKALFKSLVDNPTTQFYCDF